MIGQIQNEETASELRAIKFEHFLFHFFFLNGFEKRRTRQQHEELQKRVDLSGLLLYRLREESIEFLYLAHMTQEVNYL